MKTFFYLLACVLVFSSCSESSVVEEQNGDNDSNNVVSANIIELTRETYPDNPDWSISATVEGAFSHDSVTIVSVVNGENYDLIFTPNNNDSDTLVLSNIDLLEFMPTIPSWVKEDAYLEQICIVNQEWNRQQVKFYEGQFSFLGNNKEGKLIKRVDLARNCLNAYLWEIIGYVEEEGGYAPAYHGWFDFPKNEYAMLFKERNGIAFSKYAEYLENWKDSEQKVVDLSVLRTVEQTKEVTFETKNDEYYPLVGERKKKNPNVVYPLNVTTIQEYLSDSTQYATFSPPGFYDTKSPRETMLSRLFKLNEVNVNKVVSRNNNADSCVEFHLQFSSDDTLITQLVIGGIKLSDIPVLSIEESKNGYQMPMGIANHSFYETYEMNQSKSSLDNPYYALFLERDGRWIDSHALGVDGPLFHFDEVDNGILHLWLLSFERHTFVGHYKINL